MLTCETNHNKRFIIFTIYRQSCTHSVMSYCCVSDNLFIKFKLYFRFGMLYKSISTIRKVDTANAGKSTDKDVLQFAGQAKVRFISVWYNIFITCQTSLVPSQDTHWCHSSLCVCWNRTFSRCSEIWEGTRAPLASPISSMKCGYILTFFDFSFVVSGWLWPVFCGCHTQFFASTQLSLIPALSTFTSLMFHLWWQRQVLSCTDLFLSAFKVVPT